MQKYLMSKKIIIIIFLSLLAVGALLLLSGLYMPLKYDNKSSTDDKNIAEILKNSHYDLFTLPKSIFLDGNYSTLINTARTGAILLIIDVLVLI